MSDAAESRTPIQQEQLNSRRPTSESLVQPMAAAINSLLKRNYMSTFFKINGGYNGLAGKSRLDGFFRFKYNAQIIGVTLLGGDTGSSGTTEIDILRITTPGGPGTSIFTVTPKLTPAAGSNTWIGYGETLAGATPPSFSTYPYQVNAGDVLIMSLPQAMAGSPKDLEVQIDWLPR